MDSRGSTCVADTGVVNLDSDLMGLGRSDLDILNGQFLASFPGDGSLASYGLDECTILVMSDAM